MVKFRKPTQRSGDIIDRRGASGGRRGGLAIGAGGGGIAIIIAILFAVLGGGGGGGLEDILNQLQPATTAATETNPLDPATDPQAEAADFMSVVLDDVQAMWADIFAQSGREYQPAELVLFTGATDSGCGGADSRMGPHYCPLDSRVYLDLEFFEQLATQFGATGDLAPAYVLAHEIGHHVQNELGTDDQVRQMQQQDPAQANDLSVRMELQADCFAGVWSSTVFVGQLETGQDLALDPGEITEALEAAAAVGDDRIQETINGRVDPETFTHGTSEQRQRWFQTGYDSGNPASCDTFSGAI
ncbi:MAG TPA: neutral zinc metallopeptidase [Acidimicrobiia bacterium]|nr:neutral zinc metallopeptidase [Acidimicrobiia bacterium]